MLAELAAYNLEQGGKSLAAAKEHGVRIALGSDGGTRPANVGLELLRMVHHGLTATEALVAATATAADALGIGDEVGTVEPGKLADLVLVDGDPVAEPELFRDRDRIWLVLQLGEPVAGAALEASV
jgi:imidazolonepropionase-like amidohydrolase